MERQRILKTYKLYIGGKFPRTESGRYFRPTGANGEALDNVCRASRKDLRNAVAAAREAQKGWAERPDSNKGQILYRTAEMLEARKAQFIEGLVRTGASKKAATDEVHASIDLMVHYAGWGDKFRTLLSSVNPVSSPHFNFTVPEPMGVVTMAAPDEKPLFALCDLIASGITGGNACVVLASETDPMVAMELAEVLHDSDLPGAVVNILTGHRSELLPHMAAHKDVNALLVPRSSDIDMGALEASSAENLKRTFSRDLPPFSGEGSLERIGELQELKTTWHPVENGL